ncbi:hypothetical protein MWU75_13560 [Ornithinimicrobium sp. F0845]|uniref:alpha/beta fold hydrolase n=1 Tax=Ornithinimicrobium sp. F0845 TaxID=2926412 RepID=UPI001FF386DB|nr:hypothetical protein [Ornithinimicrobium sp. F0845]MCK0113170.1 hypothetical protein [Ornithinimicrobium sp. F0845]
MTSAQVLTASPESRGTMAAIKGPWKTVAGPGGTTVPFYVIRFDKRGVCTSPASLAHLVDAAADATDVFLFSHGWNNDWAAATRRYDQFITQFTRSHAAHWHPETRPFRPVLVGVHWPSTVLVMQDEQGPDIAAGTASDQDPEEAVPVDLLAEDLTPDQAARLYELAEREELRGQDALDFAALLVPVLTGRDDETGTGEEVTPDAADLVALWSTIPDGDTDPPPERGGFAPDASDDTTAGPQTAGWLDKLNPRNVIRSATVLLMKDRAGRVGAAGVRTMLHGILAASEESRVHLVGHSYGAKVVLSALAHGSAPSRQVESVLLLQPATSAKCFADASGGNRAGGYRPALERSKQPIMTTFSRHDAPLTKLFHFAARRASDKREAVIAGAPSEYAALGGFGPQDTSSVTVVDARTAPHRYDLPTTEVLAIRADDVISGHGDVQNAATAWALLCQVME